MIRRKNWPYHLLEPHGLGLQRQPQLYVWFDGLFLQFRQFLCDFWESFREYDACYSDYFDYPYYHSYTMDAYQNLIRGDKWSGIVQSNCSSWPAAWHDYAQKWIYNQDDHLTILSRLQLFIHMANTNNEQKLSENSEVPIAASRKKLYNYSIAWAI